MFGRSGISLVSTLSMISMIGVTTGITLLIVVLSVFNGFFGLVEGMLRSYDPDIRIQATNEGPFPTQLISIDSLRLLPEVETAYAYVEGKSLLRHVNSDHKIVIVRGVEEEHFFPFLREPGTVTLGRYSFQTKGRFPGILIGERLLDQLRITVGDQVALISAENIQRMYTQLGSPGARSFAINGGFVLKPIFDGSLVFVDIKAAQAMFRARDQYTGIDVKLREGTDASKFAEQLSASLPEALETRTWYELRRTIYDVMFLEKWGAYAILMIIILVAVLNIVGSLTMIVIQKRRDIGVLMSLGFTSKQIRNIFLFQGWQIGLISLLFGGGLGVLAVWIQQTYGVIKLFGAESFIIDAYPVVLKSGDVIAVCLTGLFLCVIAAWYPSLKAAETDPAQAIRYE